MPDKCCWVYILECSGGGLYIGTAEDVAARIDKHMKGQGALYTKTHPPVRLLATIEFPSRALAMREEKRLKKFKSEKKWDFVLGLLDGQVPEALA